MPDRMEIPATVKIYPSSTLSDILRISWKHCKRLGLPALLLAALIPMIFPIGQMFLFSKLWAKPEVSELDCTCSCWDTVFKGPYETSVARYKHVYFNSTWISAKMWMITVAGVIYFFECFKIIFSLIFRGNIRCTMFVLYLNSLHSNYYAWWMFWNYWNDHFYSQWYRQLFYTVTELVSSTITISCMDRKKPIVPLLLVILANISIFHILCSSKDQFVTNVILQDGNLHQVLRDIFLMMTDVVYTGIALFELRKYTQLHNSSIISVIQDYFPVICGITVLMFISIIST